MQPSKKLLIFLSALVCQLISNVQCHVALTYPPARKYDLDFLDTVRTEKPCGMDKGPIVTTIPAGQSLEVRWHLGYPHKGGFKLELYDPKGFKLQDLTPDGLETGAEDKTQQQYTVNIPSTLSCMGCTIRLERQALEWGRNYRFQSCADVDIVALGEYQTDCSGHGRSNGKDSCICDKTYSGDRCQFKDDCVDDSDCSYHGSCINTEATVLPRRQCFCQWGWFGQNCEKSSSIQSNNFSESLYTRIPAQGVDFYWRNLNNGEFEGVIVGLTNSWVAVGWRPADATSACQSFPSDAPPPTSSRIHPMDCTDIIMGTVKQDRLSRVGDYYTRDRSTPRRDSFWGGSDSLTGALGWEQAGRTYIMFRRAFETTDAYTTDHNFMGKLKYIWAHGRDDDAFYGEDEFKYHGPNRGRIEINGSSRQPMNLNMSVFAITLSTILARFML